MTGEHPRLPVFFIFLKSQMTVKNCYLCLLEIKNKEETHMKESKQVQNEQVVEQEIELQQEVQLDTLSEEAGESQSDEKPKRKPKIDKEKESLKETVKQLEERVQTLQSEKEVKSEQAKKLSEKEKELFQKEVKLTLKEYGLFEFEEIIKVDDSDELQEVVKKLSKIMADKKIENSFKPNGHKQQDAYSVAKSKGDNVGMIKALMGFK